MTLSTSARKPALPAAQALSSASTPRCRAAQRMLAALPDTGQTERGRRRRRAVKAAGELLHQHVGDAGLALAGQGFGQHFVVEVAHGVQLAAAHRVAG